MLGRRVVFGLLVLLNLYLFLTLIWGAGGLIAYLDLDERHSGLENKLEGLKQESIVLSREIRDLTSNAEYQRRVVREKMNYVGEKEILYIFPSGENATASEDGDE